MQQKAYYEMKCQLKILLAEVFQNGFTEQHSRYLNSEWLRNLTCRWRQTSETAYMSQ